MYQSLSLTLIIKTVKVLVKQAWLILLFFLTFMRCKDNHYIKKDNVAIKKIVIESNFSSAETPWGISDGIKVIYESKTEYFVFEIEGPPDCVKNKAEVRFTYRLDSLNKLVEEKTITYSVDSMYPFYFLNSLEVFKVEDRYGAYFFTSLLGYPYDIDPYELIMWIYFDGQLYKFSGRVSQHQDWSWEETYSFSPDERLKNTSEKVYQKITKIWNKFIENYKHTVYSQ